MSSENNSQMNNGDVHSNIGPAMDKLAETMDMTIQPIEKDDDGPAQVQQLIRCTDTDRDRWRQASALSNMTVSAWIRQTLNTEAKTLLECEHPLNEMLLYPWAKICKKCNTRIL
jgi:hypothetical protein